MTYLRDNGGNEILAADFFEAAVAQREILLKKENLFDWLWDYEPPEVDREAGDGPVPTETE